MVYFHAHMAITSSAKKAIRNSARKRVVNVRRVRAMRGAVKEAREASKDPAQDKMAKLSAAYKAIDKAQKGGIIKKNTAARKKSRLAKALNK